MRMKTEKELGNRCIRPKKKTSRNISDCSAGVCWNTLVNYMNQAFDLRRLVNYSYCTAVACDTKNSVANHQYCMTSTSRKSQ